MSTFKTACFICGLNQFRAVDFFDVNPVTVKRWFQNKAEPPQGVWMMLAERFAQIEDAADHCEHVFELDGIHPNAWSNLEATFDPNDPLPKEPAEVAGAMALLRVLLNE